MADEAAVRERLRAWIEPSFELFEEATVRHALFGRRLRVDLLAIPRDPAFSDLALAFETKVEREWDIPTWTSALKQASDYVLASVGRDLPAHAGKRVMATFVFPAPRWQSHGFREAGGTLVPHEEMFLSGIAHMASYHRVGSAREMLVKGRRILALRVGDEVWTSERGWRVNARNVLAGKRQIGSQRFPILDELARLR